MVDTTGSTQQNDAQAQDLQINLTDAPKREEAIVREPEINLDLNLNLPETPKNDNRLKNEDQENTDIAVEETIEEPITEETTTKTDKTNTVEEVEGLSESRPQSAEVIGNKLPESSSVKKDTTQTSTTIEEIPISGNTKNNKENILETSSLKEDMKIIEDIQSHTSAGGLAEEAKVNPPSTPEQTTTPKPKTFDLDAMLGNTQGQIIEPANVKISPSIPAATAVSTISPTFTIPTTTTQLPTQGILQTTTSHKNGGIKVLLFMVMFLAVGFTAFFVLKTMYPVEFANIFENNKMPIHSSAEITGNNETEIVETEENTGILDIGESENILEESTGENIFSDLEDLGDPQIENPMEKDISRLNTYLDQGKIFLDQGEVLNNKTIIKYGLYISKKSTDLLEKIENGEEINNLSGYFAQFDQYIKQLQEMTGQTPSSDSSPNELPDMTSGSNPTQDIGITSE